MAQIPVEHDASIVTATNPDELASLVAADLNQLDRPWELVGSSHAAYVSPATSVRDGGELPVLSALIGVANERVS